MANTETILIALILFTVMKSFAGILLVPTVLLCNIIIHNICTEIIKTFLETTIWQWFPLSFESLWDLDAVAPAYSQSDKIFCNLFSLSYASVILVFDYYLILLLNTTVWLAIFIIFLHFCSALLLAILADLILSVVNQGAQGREWQSF